MMRSSMESGNRNGEQQKSLISCFLGGGWRLKDDNVTEKWAITSVSQAPSTQQPTNSVVVYNLTLNVHVIISKSVIYSILIWDTIRGLLVNQYSSIIICSLVGLFLFETRIRILFLQNEVWWCPSSYFILFYYYYYYYDFYYFVFFIFEFNSISFLLMKYWTLNELQTFRNLEWGRVEEKFWK